MTRIDTASRLIAASPSRLYDAHLDPEAVAVWRAPAGMRGEVFRFEPWQGGVYRMALRYDDPSIAGKTAENEDAFEVRFDELVPGERIVELVRFTSEDPAFAGEMRLTTRFAAEGAGTRVTISAEDVPTGIRAEDHAVGMASALENLASFVAGWG